MSAFDANQSSASNALDAEIVIATGSLEASKTVAAPVNSASCTSASGVQSPNVFTGYPVLTLPLSAGSPRGRSFPARLPRTPSPRKLHSSASLSRRQLSASRTPLKGQQCIDQIFQPITSQAVSVPRAALVPDSSPLLISGQMLSSKLQPCSVSLGRRWTHPDEISVSPLLSRNYEHFPTASFPQNAENSDVPSLNMKMSEHSCSSLVMPRDNCSFDTAVSTAANPAMQSVPADAVMDTSAVKNTPVTAAEAEAKNLTVASAVSSTGCTTSNDIVLPKSANKKIVISQTMLKIPAVKLQRMQEVLEKNKLACANCVKTCSSTEVTSETSALSSPSVAGVCSTDANGVLTNCETVPASAEATSDVVHSAVRKDMLDTNTCANDGKMNVTSICEHPDSSHASQQIVPDNGVKTSSVSAANKVQPVHLADQLYGTDKQLDVEKYVAEELDEFLYAPRQCMLYAIFFSLFIAKCNI